MNTHNHVRLASDSNAADLFSENRSVQPLRDPVIQTPDAFETYVWNAVVHLPESDRRAIEYYIWSGKKYFAPKTTSEVDADLRDVVAVSRDIQQQAAVESCRG